MDQPLVSVIMPCYNAEAYIKEAIKSVLNQTYQYLELLIINDGSTDQSARVIHSMQDDRIKYYAQTNMGQAAASNFGIEKSKGKYIKFFDADDVMSHRHIEFQMAKLAGSQTSVASCEWGRFYDGNPISAIFRPESVWNDMGPLAWLKTSLSQKYDMMAAWLWLIPRALLEKAGGWDERLSLNNDFEFSVRLLLQAEKVLFAPGAKIYYRSGISSTLSQVVSEKKFKEGLLSTYLGCSYLLKADASNEMRRICANRYQEWLFSAYPNFRQFEKELQQKIKELGGSDRKLDGGKVFRILSDVFGWKNAKRIKTFLQNKGYKKLPFN